MCVFPVALHAVRTAFVTQTFARCPGLTTNLDRFVLHKGLFHNYQDNTLYYLIITFILYYLHSELLQHSVLCISDTCKDLSKVKPGCCRQVNSLVHHSN